MKAKKFELWSGITVMFLVLFLLFLVYPMYGDFEAGSHHEGKPVQPPGIYEILLPELLQQNDFKQL